MKGFTKDGKFRPTGKRTKSSLKKKDVDEWHFNHTLQPMPFSKPLVKKTRNKEIIGDDASDTGRLDDIFGDVSNDDLEIDYEKLNDEARRNIIYILKREKILKKGDKIFAHVKDWREENDGEHGYYISYFHVVRGDVEVYNGIAEGDITHGEMWDMELQVKKS